MNANRYVLRTVGASPAMYVHALAQYTMPSATPALADAKTWASARGAMTAAERHGLTNVEAVSVAVANVAQAAAEHPEAWAGLVSAYRGASKTDNAWLGGQYAGMERMFCVLTGADRDAVLTDVRNAAAGLDVMDGVQA